MKFRFHSSERDKLKLQTFIHVQWWPSYAMQETETKTKTKVHRNNKNVLTYCSPRNFSLFKQFHATMSMNKPD